MTRITCLVVWIGLGAGLLVAGCSSDDDGPRPDDGSLPDDGASGADGGAGAGGAGGAGPQGELCGETRCGERERCEAESCVCLPGFEGARCDDVAECSSPESCGAHADCLEVFGGYACECHSGFASQAGECDDVDECLTVSCPNGGSCVDQDGSFRCECPGGMVGDGWFCKATPACEGVTCGGHGDCVETVSGGVCRCDVGYAGPGCANTCEDIDFADAELEALVRALVQKPEGALSATDLAGQTTLLASNRGIESLQGLECWSGLRELHLADNALNSADLAVIAQLNQLETLVLDCNQVEELGWVEAHPTLRVLSVARTRPDCAAMTGSLAPLETLPGLERLELAAQPLGERGAAVLAPLSGLVRLRHLDLAQTQLDDEALVALGAQPLLEELNLSGNALTALPLATSFPRLRWLEASGNALTSLAGLVGLAELERLSVASCQLTALPQAAGWARLRELELSHNQLVDIGSLATLSELVWVGLVGNEVASLEAFTKPPRGTWFLYDNPVVCEPELRAASEEQLATWVYGGVDLWPWPEVDEGCSL